MYPEDQYIPISALQHFVFCKRQCLLIHAESAWSENRWTAEGRRLHERTHRLTTSREGDRLIARGLRLCSRRLGLSGAADVVEFHPCAGRDACTTRLAGPATGDEQGVALKHRPGRWRPFPVEYKRGRPKVHDADEVQLCAQAICLEEMLDTAIPRGALFYGRTRRRKEVEFREPLRHKVAAIANAIRDLLRRGITPPPEPGPKCKNCSLREICMPDRPASVINYIKRSLKQLESEVPP
jgi:CRISPR-associated exonuclease Cas4